MSREDCDSNNISNPCKSNLMEMREKQRSVHMRMMTRQSFTNWANYVLKKLDKRIVDIFDPKEYVLLEELLIICLETLDTKLKASPKRRKTNEKEKFVQKVREFRDNYFKSDQDVNCPVVVQFLWDLIEYSHITPGKVLWDTCDEGTMSAKEILLKWLNERLEKEVRNFTTDWNDGTVLCDLVNSFEPGLITAQPNLEENWLQNVTIAMETAERAWRIPMIISPDDMTSSEVDELSVMTYIALLFEYDLERTGTNYRSHQSNNHSEFGETIEDEEEKNIDDRSSEGIMGIAGKEIEYRLDLHDINANEITVSVEFKPCGKVTGQYKPDLKVFSMGNGRFNVKYTPNVAGRYRLCMYYKDEHIADSPYCVEVLPNNDVNNNENDLSDLDNEEISRSKQGFYGIDGKGLRHATVGKLATFTVITDNRDKGPLSVCINCPAVSLPVPHVKTTCSKNYSTHTVSYMPTLAGTYNIYVRWGLKLINGAPFEVNVRDYEEHEVSLSRKEQTEKRNSTQFSHIKVYYCISSMDPLVIRETKELEDLLKRYGLCDSIANDIWVSVDVEMQKDERDLIFRLAGTTRLPLLFIHEECLGGWEQVKELDERNELEERLMFKIRTV